MRFGLACAFLLATSGCSHDRTRPCASQADCVLGGAQAECVPSPSSDQSWCAFLDPECGAGGARWSPLAGDGLAGECHTITYRLTVSPTGDGMITSMPAGIACGPDCEDSFPLGTAVVLSVAPGAGWTFNGWSGDASNCSTDESCTVVVDHDLDVGGLFVEGYRLTINLAGDGRGRVIAGDGGVDCDASCSMIAPPNASVELRVVPSAGSRFDGWSGECAGAGLCYLLMTAPRTVDVALSDVRDWSFGLGDTQDDAGVLAAFDDDNLIVVGTFSGEFILGSDTLTSDGATSDIFVTKLGPSGVPLWSRRIGGPGTDVVSGLVVYGNHDIAIAGTFEDTMDVGTGPLVSAGGRDGFAAQLSGQFGAMYANTYGGLLDDEVNGLAIASPGGIIVCGSFQDQVDFGSFAGTITATGNRDAFIHYDSGWVVTSSSATTAEARCRAVAVDSTNTVVAVGDFNSTADFGTGMLSAAGSSDIFTVQVAVVGGMLQRSVRLGGMGYDAAHAVAVDPTDNIYIVGEFSDLLDFGGGPMMPDVVDGFILRLSPTDLSHVWSRQVGGSGTDIIRRVAATASSVFVAGSFQSRVDFDPGTAVSAGESDAFVLEVTANDGLYTWINGMGGTQDDGASGVSATTAGRVAVTGHFMSDVDFGGGPISSVGGQDAFVVSLSP